MGHSTDDMIREPIFLVGSERSGSTLLRLMLDHHPRIAFYSEFPFPVEKIGDDGTFPPLDAYHKWVASHWMFSASGLTLDTSLDYPKLVNSFLEQKRRRDGKQLVGATVHWHFDRLRHVWPDARYIHILRDGRDVARSCIRMGWAGNVWMGSETWIEAERSWTTLLKQLPESRYCEVRYEELIGHPRENLEAICGFIRVPFDEAMLSFPDDSTYDLPDTKLVFQWKEKAPVEEIRLAEARIGDLLVERGYALSGLPKLEPSRLRIRKLQLQDRWARRLFRVRRYGLSLTALSALSRRRPFGWLDSYVSPRIERIRRRYLR